MSHKVLMNLDEMEAAMQATRELQAASLLKMMDLIMEDVATGQHEAAGANPPRGDWTVVVADDPPSMVRKLSVRLNKHGICCVDKRKQHACESRTTWSLRMMTREELATYAATQIAPVLKSSNTTIQRITARGASVGAATLATRLAQAVLPARPEHVSLRNTVTVSASELDRLAAACGAVASVWTEKHDMIVLYADYAQAERIVKFVRQFDEEGDNDYSVHMLKSLPATSELDGCMTNGLALMLRPLDPTEKGVIHELCKNGTVSVVIHVELSE
jgi:hypothetical protein